MQIAIVLYPGMTALDAIGPYEVLRYLPGSEIRFLHHAVGPVMTDSGVLTLGASHTFEQTPAPDLLLAPGSESDTGSAAAAVIPAKAGIQFVPCEVLVPGLRPDNGAVCGTWHTIVNSQ